MKEEILKFPDAAYKEFPQMDYGVNLFSEAIHYNTQGEKKLNADFKNQVYPEIISHIKNLEKGTPWKIKNFYYIRSYCSFFYLHWIDLGQILEARNQV